MTHLDVRLDGFADPIGTLSSNDRGAVTFAYRENYASRRDALALSLSLPLSVTQFDDFATRAYFDNLLQERDTARADIIAKYRLSNDDLVGILFHLGKDCAGAVSVLPMGSLPTKVPGRLGQHYRPYAADELSEIVLGQAHGHQGVRAGGIGAQIVLTQRRVGFSTDPFAFCEVTGLRDAIQAGQDIEALFAAFEDDAAGFVIGQQAKHLAADLGDARVPLINECDARQLHERGVEPVTDKQAQLSSPTSGKGRKSTPSSINSATSSRVASP